MSSTDTAPAVTPVLGGDVANEVLQWIGAFRSLAKATIVSYGLQDYDFGGQRVLSELLRRQIAYGARVTVMTTPPQGSGRGQDFRRKLGLLEELDKNGADVYVHPDVHAKAYLFEDNASGAVVIVGSPNLTAPGFGTHGTARELLELALLSGEQGVYSSTEKLIIDALIGNAGTMDFATWVAQNATSVAAARGAM